MAFSHIIKTRAFALFLQGLSYEAAAKQLTAEFGVKVSAGSLRSWAQAKDGAGRSWADYRAETRASAGKRAMFEEQSRLKALRDKAGMLQDKLYEQITSEAAPKVGSLEGSLYAWKTIADFCVKLDDKAREAVNIGGAVQMLLEILAQVPEVRQAISANWAAIEKEIRVRILNEEPESLPAGRAAVRLIE